MGKRKGRSGPAYGGDRALERMLRRAGSGLDAAAVRALVVGVLAAPDQVDPESWMALVSGQPEDGLKGQLRALGAEMAAAPTGPGVPRTRRLADLRAELARRGLEGFIVPRTDEHQGEYVSARAERLAWLTGFNGSAGLAVVLEEHAAIFVDGRYTLQVRAQVDDRAYAVRHLTEEPATDWIAVSLAAGARLGYDPWLHTPREVARYQAACERAGAALVACEENPLDAVWPDQPPPPISPVIAHDAALAGRSSADKRRELAETLSREKAGAVVLTAADSIAWLFNLRGGDVPYTPLPLAFAIAHDDATAELFVDSRKLTPGLGDHLGDGVRVAATEGFGPALDRLGSQEKNVRLDPDRSPSWAVDRAEKAGAAVVYGPDPCQLPKARKNPVELEGARAAHRRDGTAVTRFLAWLAREAAGGTVTEIAAAERLEVLRRRNDRFRGLSFPTISGAGPNGAIVHYRVTPETERRLEAGSLYLVDSGGQYLDGTTDVTRTVAIGAPEDEMRDRFTRVLKGHIAIARARFPKGTTGSQLDVLARRHLWDAGLDYDHGTGHGVGSYLGVHEGPQRISKVANRTGLEPGMIVSNEPGYYKTGQYGIRIENLVCVVCLATPAGAERELLGFETLTLAPLDLALVEPGLLDADEVGWLDDYHARVRETVLPLVDAETGAWLARATRPVGG